MPTIPLRADNAYVSFGKQAVQGTAVAPVYFPRWMEGSSIAWDGKFEDVWEGDGSRRLSLIIRSLNQVKVKLVVTPRPNEMAMLESAAMGTGSDSVTASTPSTTTTATITGGTSTTVTVASASLLSGSGTIQLLVDTVASGVQELVTFTLPISTLTLTVAASYNGGKFKNSHGSGVLILSVSSVNTSITTTAAAGASSLAVGNNNNDASFPVTLCVSQGTANEEFVTFSGISGAGPYTLTVAASYNGGVTVFPHTLADIVISPVAHVETDQVVGDYYTGEVGLGSLNSQGGITLRCRDGKLDSIKRSGKSGGLLMYEVEFTFLVAVVQVSPSTVTLENHQPLLFQQGAWTLDGSTTGDAPNVEQFAVDQKNNLDLVQTESFVGAAIIFGQIHVDFTADIVYQATTTRAQLAMTGSNAGTTDAQAVGVGALILLFSSADNFNSVQYKTLTLIYTKASLPTPKTDGKHMKMSIQASSISNQGNNAYVLQSTVSNTTSTPF